MVTVTFYEDSHHRLSSFFASGHAEAGVEGDDVICAAVSAILQAARAGLEEHLHLALDIEQKKGHMRIAWPEHSRADAAVQAVVAAAHLSIEQIARQHPKNVRCNIEPLERVR